jgi:hypothetical protein
MIFLAQLGDNSRAELRMGERRGPGDAWTVGSAGKLNWRLTLWRGGELFFQRTTKKAVPGSGEKPRVWPCLGEVLPDRRVEGPALEGDALLAFLVAEHGELQVENK